MSDPIWALLWTLCGLLVGGLEFVALSRPAQGDTLSENLRVKLRQHQWIRWASLVGWVGFSVWFAIHIWFD